MASPPFTPRQGVGADGEKPEPTLPMDDMTVASSRNTSPLNGAKPAHRPRQPVDEPRWRTIGAYLLIGVMALADAFGFWVTLTRIIRRDTLLVAVFVVALALSSLLVAHQIGRIARSRREGYDGSILWISLLAVLWLGLGCTIAYIRARQQDVSSGLASGALAPAASAAADDKAVELAALLLVLYLLTGALAINHGYRRGDPRTAAVRQAYARRESLAMALAERRYENELARGLLALRRSDLRREEVDSDHEHEVEHGHATHLKSAARRFTARHIGDPAGTDELYSDRDVSSAPPSGLGDWLDDEPPTIT